MSDLLNMDMANEINTSCEADCEINKLLVEVVVANMALAKAKKALDDKIVEIEKGLRNDTI